MRLPRALAWFVTFNFVNIAWVFFRARTWDDAVSILRAMAGLKGVSLATGLSKLGINFGSLVFMHVNRNIVAVLTGCLLIAVLARNSNELSERFRPSAATGALVVLMAVYALLSIHNVTEFLYFNF
jgi:D-alanyl-lipoteichoic acid acyltransferase DltB (MBOAT superfamily)